MASDGDRTDEDPLEEEEAIEAINELFNEIEDRIKRLEEESPTGEKSAEVILMEVNSNLMLLGFGLTQILNRVGRITKALITRLSPRLGTIWFLIGSLMKRIRANIENWSIGSEFTISATPSVAFSVTVTYRP